MVKPHNYCLSVCLQAVSLGFGDMSVHRHDRFAQMSPCMFTPVAPCCSHTQKDCLQPTPVPTWENNLPRCLMRVLLLADESFPPCYIFCLSSEYIWVLTPQEILPLLLSEGRSVRGKWLGPGCDDKRVSVCGSGDSMWRLSLILWPLSWTAWKDFNLGGSEGLNNFLSLIFNEKKKPDKSIILRTFINNLFFLLSRTTTASHLENSSSISNNTVLKNVKLLYKFLIEKRIN